MSGRSADWWTTTGVVSVGHMLSHVYALTLPPLFPLMRDDLGFSSTGFGILVAMFAVAGLLQMPLGSLVDRIGAKKVLVAGTTVLAVGMALIGLAPSYSVMLVVTLLAGVGLATFHPADYALLTAVSDADSESRAFSLHLFAGYVGFAITPVAVGGFALATSWRLALLAVGAIGLVFAAVEALVLDDAYLDELESGDEESDDEESDDASFIDDLRLLARPTIFGMFLFMLVLTIGNKGLSTFTPVLMVDGFGLSKTLGNTALTAYFAVGALAILVGGTLADRYDPRRVLVVAVTVIGALVWALVGGPLSVTPAVAIGAFGLMGLLQGAAVPSRDRLVSDFTPDGAAGKSFGFVLTAISVSGLLAPPILGAVIDAWSVFAAFEIMSGFFLVAALVALALGSRTVRASGGVAQAQEE
ncbi:MAG: MFS transporter [Haloarculaceae archaeon]